MWRVLSIFWAWVASIYRAVAAIYQSDQLKRRINWCTQIYKKKNNLHSDSFYKLASQTAICAHPSLLAVCRRESNLIPSCTMFLHSLHVYGNCKFCVGSCIFTTSLGQNPTKCMSIIDARVTLITSASKCMSTSTQVFISVWQRLPLCMSLFCFVIMSIYFTYCSWHSARKCSTRLSSARLETLFQFNSLGENGLNCWPILY